MAPKDFIRLEDTDKYVKQVYWVNGSHMGHVYVEVDGYWVYVRETNGGAWSELTLRAIADTLFDLNKDWNEQVVKSFEEAGGSDNIKTITNSI